MLVVANTADYNFLKSQLNNKHPAIKIVGNINPKAADTDGTLGSINNLKQIVQSNHITDVVFFENVLSFREMIELMLNQSDNVQFCFHATGSRSIIGSSDKNKRGDVLLFS